MDIDAQRAQRLFQAVVTQCVIDACKTPRPPNEVVKRNAGESDAEYDNRRRLELMKRHNDFHRAMRQRNEARRWLLEDEEGFPEVVSLAGYDPSDVRERSHKMAAAGWVNNHKHNLKEAA